MFENTSAGYSTSAVIVLIPQPCSGGSHKQRDWTIRLLLVSETSWWCADLVIFMEITNFTIYLLQISFIFAILPLSIFFGGLQQRLVSISSGHRARSRAHPRQTPCISICSKQLLIVIHSQNRPIFAQQSLTQPQHPIYIMTFYKCRLIP